MPHTEPLEDHTGLGLKLLRKISTMLFTETDPYCHHFVDKFFWGYRLAFPSEDGERGHISQATVLAPSLSAALCYTSLSYCHNKQKNGMRGFIFPSDGKDKGTRTAAGFLFSG